ncbi:MAG: amidohydrolase [Acidobacteria bacterium]|nr:amidohydrolase [Acidobacteriota bacterium]
MKTIALEEHFVTADFLKATGAYEKTPEPMRALQGRLQDLGEGRIQAMDEGGVGIQVLSLAAMGKEELSAEDQTAVFHGVHDELAAAIARHPERFRGFCTPGLKEPANAVKEMERCLKLPGFVGVLLDGMTDGKFLDAPEFFPFLEAVEAAGVPLYLHPAPPPEDVFARYYAGLPGETGFLMSIAGWGWHSETAIHTLRLILAGVFDRLPKLQLILGHMGEMLPYALARSNAVLSGAAKHLQRSVLETFQEQIHVTTSGYFTRPPFECCREVLGLERMMYSVDYPFSPNTKGRDFLAGLELSDAEMEALVHGNAARLLCI